MNAGETLETLGLSRLEDLFDLRLDAQQKSLTARYLLLLAKWRRAMNLTGRSSNREILQFDFFESFWVADHFLAEARRLVDIGSGAGFPGLAVKIRRPDLPVVLVEPNLKKTVFLRETARQLSLQVECFQGRDQDYSSWQQGDAAAIRALRPGEDLLTILRARGLSLLWLHGAGESAGPEGFELRLRLAVPGSQRRVVSLFDCPSPVFHVKH